MYTKEQASHRKQEFWTRFGKYMAPVLSAEGEKINWINYKTGIRHLNFKMNATQEFADIGIEVGHKDPPHAAALYEQFKMLRPVLEAVLGEEWTWEPKKYNEHLQLFSSISLQHQPCNILRDSDWPEIISFLKPRIIRLDQFWCEHRMIFEMI